MKPGEYRKPVERKPVGRVWIAVGAVIAALIGTGYTLSRAAQGRYVAQAGDSAFESGSALGGQLGSGFAMAIVVWLIFWGLCRANSRMTGWVSFAIFALAATIPAVIVIEIAKATAQG